MKTSFHIQVQQPEQPASTTVVQEHSTFQTNQGLTRPTNPHLDFTVGSANWRFDMSSLETLINKFY